MPKKNSAEGFFKGFFKRAREKRSENNKDIVNDEEMGSQLTCSISPDKMSIGVYGLVSSHSVAYLVAVSAGK